VKTALDFYEDDEDPHEVLAAFEAGEQRVTIGPSSARFWQDAQSGGEILDWAEVAEALRGAIRWAARAEAEAPTAVSRHPMTS
jgi:hypothetical protein